jgi:hypothetical protein
MPFRGFAVASAALLVFCHSFGQFSNAERQSIVQFWNQPGRYNVSTLEGESGSWVVRQTVDGSKWLMQLDKARGLQKGAHVNRLSEPMENWIEARIAFDKCRAEMEAESQNGQGHGPYVGRSSAVDPGPTPPPLEEMAGPAPAFVEAVRPQKYEVRFDDALATYVDEPALDPRGVSFRYANGVRSSGTKIKDEEMAPLIAAAGLTDTEARVMQAISPLEGSFDAINTYDTGIVSVGFIQFSCREKGAGSLGQVLLREKTEDPNDFQKDFRAFGVDVDDSGVLDVVDPQTGAEATGPDAAHAIVDDKRLTATLQRAGLMSSAFRIAQLQTAKDLYYPASNLIAVPLGDSVAKVRVGDVVRSEAGLAILMDRKVHRGSLAPLATVIAAVARDCHADSVDAIAAHELSIDQAMTYRADFLSNTTLSQPSANTLAVRRSRRRRSAND